VVENRLYTGCTDGSLRVWTLKGLRSTDEQRPGNTASPADAEDAARQRNAAEP